MNPITDDLKEFFALLWRGGNKSCWWTAPNQQSYWFPIEEGLATAQRKFPKAKTQNIYFGVHPVSKIPPTNSKGEQTSIVNIRSQNKYIAAINCVYAEFDSLEEIATEIPPSVEIFSGGGFHCYWLLDETFYINNDADLEYAKKLQAQWVIHVGSDPASKDLSRVLRVPGTQNRKEKYKPGYPTVELRKCDLTLRYAIEQFEVAPIVIDEPRPVIDTSSIEIKQPWFAAAIEGELDRMRNATNGTRNDTLNKVAFRIGQFVPHAISESEANEMVNQARYQCSIPQDEGKAKATRERGILAGMANPDYGPQDETPAPQSNTSIESEDAEATAEDTWPYAISNGDMVYCKQTMNSKTGLDEIAETRICKFSAKIIEIVHDLGEDTYIIAGTSPFRGNFNVEVTAKDFAEPRTLKSIMEAAAFDPVDVNMSGYLGPAIKSLSTDIAQSVRYRKTGWVNGQFLMPGRTPDKTECVLDRELPYRTDRPSNVQDALKALTNLMGCVPKEQAPILLSAILGAPLARVAGWEDNRYALFIQGETGCFKTSTAKCFMAIFGAGFTSNESLVRWGDGATPNAIMHMATSAGDLPFLIDNYKPNTGRGADGFISMIHSIMEGSEKARMERSANALRESSPIHCWPICTGEDFPDTDAAATARSLIIKFERASSNSDKLAQAQRTARALQSIGGLWLDWLESAEGQREAASAMLDLEKERQNWAKILLEISPTVPNPYRIATTLAINELTFKIAAYSCDQIGEILKPYIEAHKAGLKAIAQTMVQGTAEASEASKFLSALEELIASRSAILLVADDDDMKDARNRDRIIGWNDGEGGAYLLPDMSMAAVERIAPLGGISKGKLYGQLKGLGRIKSNDAGRGTKNKRIGGRTQKVLHITDMASPKNSANNADDSADNADDSADNADAKNSSDYPQDAP